MQPLGRSDVGFVSWHLQNAGVLLAQAEWEHGRVVTCCALFVGKLRYTFRLSLSLAVNPLNLGEPREERSLE